MAEKIKMLRREKKMTQEQLGDILGISRCSVISYENGDAVAKVTQLQEVAKALNASYDYLFYNDVTDRQKGKRKMFYIDMVQERYGIIAGREVDRLLENSAALFHRGEMAADVKEVFYSTLTDAYLRCKEEYTAGNRAESRFVKKIVY